MIERWEMDLAVALYTARMNDAEAWMNEWKQKNRHCAYLE
jgi:hypothetical protein